MTERCQRKFTEQFDNQKYIIYFVVITASLTVLYFCRFHFATLGISYGLGCVACYFVVNSSYLNTFVDHLKCHFDKNPTEDKIKDPAVKGCVTCGSKDCSRHDEARAAEPWEGLQIHKQLDQAIEDFFNTILDQFISSWFSKITLQPFFVDELRHQLRYASACLLQRALKIDYARLITDRLLPCALRHITTSTYSLESGRTPPLHPAAANRDAEMKYLRCVTDALMPYLLNADDVQNSVFRVLIREIFAGWVLLSITDVLADPYILNTIIILATGDETMAQLPTTPNYKVEFLETFVRHTESVYSARPRLLRAELGALLSEPRGLYAVMQHMKATRWLQLLQFYRDIKSFQSQLLNPEPRAAEVAALRREAKLLAEYTSTGLPLRPHVLAELNELLAEADSDDGIKKLQTSRALYEAARQSHAILEKIMLPRFLHSEEFYKMILGPRIPTGYQKQVKVTKKTSYLRPESIDGQVLDCFNSEERDGSEKMDILNYLDALSADEFHTREHDLSNYKVVLTNVETRLQYPPRRGTVRVFTLAVHRVMEAMDVNFWTVERNEHDFHLLRSKLHEFHGDTLLVDLALPSRRDNSPLETLRYKYEDFLQRLLQKKLLQTSELLHLFLTVDGDFSTVVQASTLNANSTDLANLYQSVTYKLKKEKGQHLESFLMNLLFSTDLERFQALKQGSGRDVEEAVEVSEDAELDIPSRTRCARDIKNSVFGNNWDQTPEGYESRDLKHQDVLKGFSQCLMYLLTRVIVARGALWRVLGCVLSRCSHQTDAVVCGWLTAKLAEWLSERRLAHFIRLGHNLLFGKKSTPRCDPDQQRSQAASQLLRCVPALATLAAGGGLPRAVSTAFTLIQSVHYNKQLVYNLLDLCLMELFPELGATDKSSEPKS